MRWRLIRIATTPLFLQNGCLKLYSPQIPLGRHNLASHSKTHYNIFQAAGPTGRFRNGFVTATRARSARFFRVTNTKNTQIQCISTPKATYNAAHNVPQSCAAASLPHEPRASLHSTTNAITSQRGRAQQGLAVAAPAVAVPMQGRHPEHSQRSHPSAAEMRA